MKKNILAVLTIVVILGSVGLNFGYINSSNGSQVILLNHLSSKINPNFKESSIAAPILVDGNDDLTQFPGNGTEGNPYVIQNYVIHSMSGGPAIEIRNTDAFLIIKNCTVSGSVTHMQGGIVLFNCENVKITECIAKNNSVGIKLEYSHNNIVSHNNVSYNHWMGIYLAGSDNNIISENFGFKSGIFISIHWWSQKNEISGNNATNFGVGIQVAYSNNNTVLNNMVMNSPDGVGIAIALSSNNIISGNDVSYANIGIEVIFSDNNMFSGNTATHTINGILLIGSNNSIISGNYLIENDAGGILLSNSIKNNIFENDLLYNYQFGIGLFTSNNNTISKNNMSVNLIYSGILLQNADFNIIQNNFITKNKEYGIWLQSSRYNKILVNTIANNSGYGLYLSLAFGTGVPSIGNHIYLNSFIGNSWSQAYCPASCTGNFWDNGSLGNYWSDYKIRYPNATNDGVVWDTPYEINGSTLDVDTFPLVHPYIEVPDPCQELENMKKMVINSPDSAWRNPTENRKIAMIEKIDATIALCQNGEYDECYDKVLQDIKPKLTRLKIDEEGNPFGNGVFNNPWIIDQNLQQEFGEQTDLILRLLKSEF